MMFRIAFILLLISGTTRAQDSVAELDRVYSLFQNFEYQSVISAADSIMKRSAVFDTTARLELLRMKGIAEYSLKQQDEARYTFLEILQLDNSYVMDPFDTPPKIVELFNIIKTSYNSRPVREKIVVKTDSVLYMPEKPSYSPETVLLRSALIPGWGHFSYGKKGKGRWLAIGTLFTLPPALYFSWESSIKEEDYLNETDHNRIESRYDEFNHSYKLRNLFLIAYTGVWLYSQLDILRLNDRQRLISVDLQPIPLKENGLAVALNIRF